MGSGHPLGTGVPPAPSRLVVADTARNVPMRSTAATASNSPPTTAWPARPVGVGARTGPGWPRIGRRRPHPRAATSPTARSVCRTRHRRTTGRCRGPRAGPNTCTVPSASSRPTGSCRLDEPRSSAARAGRSRLQRSSRRGSPSGPRRWHQAPLSRAEAANGQTFDRLFAELMIEHHRGAIAVADEEIAAGQYEQQAEITELQAFLDGTG
jgi:hypothetical protein